MKERTKKLIIELHQSTGSVRSLEIEKEFPRLFKEQAFLLKKARKRYKNGDVFISPYSGKELIIRNINSIKLYDDGDITVDGSGLLLSDGVWGKIVSKTITKKQAEKELGKIIIN